MVFALMGGEIDDVAADKALREAGLSAEDAQAYRDSLPGSTGANVLGQALTDRMFRVPTEELCDARSGAEGRTYVYQSAWRSSGMGGISGRRPLRRRPVSPSTTSMPQVWRLPWDLSLLRRWRTGCIGAWVDFVTEGDPKWPAFGAETRSTMIFDRESAVVDDPLRIPRSLFGAA